MIQRYLIMDKEKEILTNGHRKLKIALKMGNKLSIKHGMVAIWDTKIKKYIRKLYRENNI